VRGVGLIVLSAFAVALALVPGSVLAANPSEHAALQAQPTSLHFPDGGSAAQTVTVSNGGDLAAQLATPVVSTGFTISGRTCGPGPLPKGDSCTVTILTARGGPFAGTLTIHDGSIGAVPPDLIVPLNILGPTPPPPPQGSIFLNPSSAPPASRVNFSGTGLPVSTLLAVTFDGGHLVDINTDGNGAFAIQLAIPNDATGVNHQICVVENYGNLCTGFTLEANPGPTPTPSDSPSASPSPSPSTSPVAPVATTSSGGSSPLAVLTRPPFVFLPIIAAIGLLAFLALYLWRGRPTPPIGEVTILHRAPEPRVYGPQPDSPPPAPAPSPPPPVVYESPPGPASSPPPPRPPAPPGGADVPPEMPEASD
jgi:hypothetical protein